MPTGCGITARPDLGPASSWWGLPPRSVDVRRPRRVSGTTFVTNGGLRHRSSAMFGNYVRIQQVWTDNAVHRAGPVVRQADPRPRQGVGPAGTPRRRSRR